MFDKGIYNGGYERKDSVKVLLRLGRVLSFFLVILRFGLTVLDIEP